MASVINAATSPAALIQTSDGTAILKLQTEGTDGLVLDENQNVTINNGLTVSGAVVFNDAGADVDFRVEGDTEANLLFVDASADNIGMGTNSITTFGTAYRTLQLQASSGTGDGSAIRFMYDGGTVNTNDLVVYNNSSGGNIRQNGALTLNFLVNGSERMRITSDGYLRMAGGGIQFNGDTAAANALDDYEEGIWTPAFTPASGSYTSLTYSQQNGHYTKIGNMVYALANITVSAVNTSGASGDLNITGLPFSLAGETRGAGCFSRIFNMNLGTDVLIFRLIADGTTKLRIDTNTVNSASPNTVAATEIKASSRMDFLFSYQV